MTEAEKQDDGDWLFFGFYRDGYNDEFGYFMLSQLEEVELPFGLKIERDLYTKLSTLGKMLS